MEDDPIRQAAESILNAVPALFANEYPYVKATRVIRVDDYHYKEPQHTLTGVVLHVTDDSGARMYLFATPARAFVVGDPNDTLFNKEDLYADVFQTQEELHPPGNAFIIRNWTLHCLSGNSPSTITGATFCDVLGRGYRLVMNP